MPGKRTMRYFFINLLSILLPLLVISFVVTQMLIVRVQEEEKEKLSMQLEEIAVTLSTDFQDFRNKSIALFENREFDSKQVVRSPITARKAIQLLKSLKLFDGSTEAMTIYYDTGFLYDGNGRISPSTFFATTLLCDWDSTEAAMAALEAQEARSEILYKQPNGGYLMYHIPVGTDYMGYSRSAQFFYSFSKLGQLIEGSLNSTGVLVELEIKGKKIYFLSNVTGIEAVEADKVDAILHRYEKDFLEQTVTEADMTIRLWFDLKEQLADFYSMRNFYTALLIIGVCFSLLMSFRFSKKRQSRIEALVYNIKNKNTEKSDSKKWMKNEFDYIQSVLNESIVENNEIRMNARMYRKVLFKQVSTMIFHGLLREREEIQNMLKVCGTELFEDYFYLCGVTVEQHQLGQLENMIQADLHYVKQEGENIYVLILCELPQEDPSMVWRHEIAKRFQAVLESVDIVCRQVVMSRVYKEISMVNYGYLEVLSILKHLPKESKQIICFEEWSRNNRLLDVHYSDEDFKLFHEALGQRNEQQICSVLKKMLQKAAKQGDEEIRYMRFMIVQELLLEFRSTEKIGEHQQLISDLTAVRLENTAEFAKEIQRIAKVYCSSKENLDDFNDIIQFVKDNYTSFDFSLDKVAEYAGMSKSQMSKVFRARTGMGYIDYVTLLRMEKVKELLLQTDLSIKDIFGTVGYMDVTNASRKFKSYYGVNPSIYREQEREQKGSE